METETFKNVLFAFTLLTSFGIIGWAVADYISFKRNLK